MKDTFLIHRKHKAAFDKLSDMKDKGRLIDAILDYCFGDGNNNVSDNPTLDMAFTMIKNDIDENTRHYNDVCEKRAEAGRKHSGNQYTRKAEQMEQLFQIGTNGTNGTDNDNENDNDNDILINENEKEKSDKKKSSSKKFVEPTLDEIKAYIEEKSLEVDAEQFLDHYDANGWKAGRTPMKDWKATLRNWHRRRNEYGFHSIQKPDNQPKFTY